MSEELAESSKKDLLAAAAAEEERDFRAAGLVLSLGPDFKQSSRTTLQSLIFFLFCTPAQLCVFRAIWSLKTLPHFWHTLGLLVLR